MNMKKQFIFLFAAVMMLTACSSDRDDEYSECIKPVPGEIVPASPVFNASLDDDTRAYISNKKVLWSKRDYISIFLKRCTSDSYTLQQGAGTTDGVFWADNNIEAHEAEIAHYVAMYPAIYNSKIFTTGTGYRMDNKKLYSQQWYSVGNDSLSSDALMVAVSKDTNLKFKNVFGMLKLSLKNSSGMRTIIKKVRISEPSGTINHKFDLYMDVKESDFEFRVDVSKYEPTGHIELNLTENLKLTDKPQDLYVNLLPLAYKEGLKVEILNDKDEVLMIYNTKSLEIHSGKILSMPEADLGTYPVTADAATHTINCSEPGHLFPAHISEAAGSSKKLKVTGSIDGADIRLIREAAGCRFSLENPRKEAIVTSLDLSDANIVASDDLYEENNKITADNTIGNYMFYNSSLTSLILPANITSIGESSLVSSPITEISIPADVTLLNSACFSGCLNLSKVIFEGSKIEKLGMNAFYDCIALKSIDIPSSVKTIGAQCFSYTGLESATIPSSVTSIEDNVFYNCNLTTLTLKCKRQGTTIAPDAFFGINSQGGRTEDCDLKIDESWMPDISFIDKSFHNYRWKSISPVDRKYFCDVNADTHTITTHICGTITAEAISEAVGNGSMLKVAGEIGGLDLRFIREATGCLYGNSDESKGNVKTLDLSEARLKGDGGEYMFGLNLGQDNSLPNSSFSKSHAEKIILPNSIDNIDCFCFEYSKIKSLTVPESVTTISNSIVYECPNLTAIQIKGTPNTGSIFEGFNNSANCLLYLNKSFKGKVNGNVFEGKTWKNIFFGTPHNVDLGGITDEDML